MQLALPPHKCDPIQRRNIAGFLRYQPAQQYVLSILVALHATDTALLQWLTWKVQMELFTVLLLDFHAADGEIKLSSPSSLKISGFKDAQYLATMQNRCLLQCQLQCIFVEVAYDSKLEAPSPLTV